MFYYIKAYKNYAKFKGCATRKEYWWFILYHTIFYILFVLMDVYFDFYIPVTDSTSLGCLQLIYLIISALPGNALTVRRLHDIGKSSIWWCVQIIPIFGDIYFIYLLTRPSIDPSIHSTNEHKEYNTYSHNLFCSECGKELTSNSNFCNNCGTKVVKMKQFPAYIFDTSTHLVRKELVTIDIIKIPPSKYADSDTYYIIETYQDGSKVRIYCTKDNWNKKMENSLQTN